MSETCAVEKVYVGVYCSSRSKVSTASEWKYRTGRDRTYLVEELGETRTPQDGEEFEHDRNDLFDAYETREAREKFI